MIAVYILLAIILLMLCYIIFSIGRLYESIVEFRKLDEKIQKTQREIESYCNQIKKSGV